MRAEFVAEEESIGVARGAAEDVLTYCQINILEGSLANTTYIDLQRKNAMDFLHRQDTHVGSKKNGVRGLDLIVDDDLLTNNYDIKKTNI